MSTNNDGQKQNEKQNSGTSWSSKMVEGQQEAWKEIQSGYSKNAKSLAKVFSNGINDYMAKATESEAKKSGSSLTDLPINTAVTMMESFQSMTQVMADFAETHVKAAGAMVKAAEK